MDYLSAPCMYDQKQISQNLTPNMVSNLPLNYFFMKKSPSFNLENADTTDVTHSSIMTESLNQTNSSKSIEVLDLLCFKTQPCQIKIQHNYKTCFFYHNSKDRRRTGNYFSSDLCEYGEQNSDMCPLGDYCPKSHNRLEQLYHVEKYKTKFCSHYPKNIQNCEYGIYCSFAHAEHEILIDLIHNYDFDEDFFLFHYKTVWCPFNLTQHDKGLCVYAHNWQDFRRKSNLYNYEPSSCPNWNHNKIIVNYEDGCVNSFTCPNCHGWKENEFHPLNYRTKPCPNINNCTRGFACPFYHNIKDKRNISQHVQNQYFKLFPRNRIISNTFKIRRNSCTATYRKSSSNNSGLILNPVIEENEKESKNQYYVNQEIPETKTSYDNFVCLSTPKKKNGNMMNEPIRTHSESLSRNERYEKFDNKFEEGQDFFKTSEIIKSLESFTGKNNINVKECDESQLSNNDDDFSDLVEQIKKMTE